MTAGTSDIQPIGALKLRRLCGVLLAGCGLLLLMACGGSEGPRVVDERAGLSYVLPSGWQERPREDLLEFFTSVSSREISENNGALIALGQTEGLFAEDAPDLATMAEALAIDFAEFFVPFAGERDKTADESLEIGGNDAHRVRFLITPDEEQEAVVEAVVVQRGDDASFVLGVVSPRSTSLERQLGGAVESLVIV